MRKLLSVALVIMICFGFSMDIRSESPDLLRQEAFADISTGSSIMQRAANSMSNANNESDLKVAIQLFAEAGRLFQIAKSKLEVLVPEYASQADLDGCEKAMDSCINAINNIKKRLTQI